MSMRFAKQRSQWCLVWLSSLPHLPSLLVRGQLVSVYSRHLCPPAYSTRKPVTRAWCTDDLLPGETRCSRRAGDPTAVRGQHVGHVRHSYAHRKSYPYYELRQRDLYLPISEPAYLHHATSPRRLRGGKRSLRMMVAKAKKSARTK